MKDLLQLDLGSNLLSLAIILGWFGISLVFLRILAIAIKEFWKLYLKNHKH